MAGKDVADTQPPTPRQVVNGVEQGPGSHGTRSPSGPWAEVAAGVVESAPPAACIGSDTGVEGAPVDIVASDGSPGRGAANGTKVSATAAASVRHPRVRCIRPV